MVTEVIQYTLTRRHQGRPPLHCSCQPVGGRSQLRMTTVSRTQQAIHREKQTQTHHSISRLLFSTNWVILTHMIDRIFAHARQLISLAAPPPNDAQDIFSRPAPPERERETDRLFIVWNWLSCSCVIAVSLSVLSKRTNVSDTQSEGVAASPTLFPVDGRISESPQWVEDAHDSSFRRSCSCWHRILRLQLRRGRRCSR